ncbi:MAG: hypothetical protein MUE52_01100 [Tabrizicola sp.]|jgi:hypothetical protein|nr:hypothetical protein [Tabrizicola sp.]
MVLVGQSQTRALIGCFGLLMFDQGRRDVLTVPRGLGSYLEIALEAAERLA